MVYVQLTRFLLLSSSAIYSLAFITPCFKPYSAVCRHCCCQRDGITYCCSCNPGVSNLTPEIQGYSTSSGSNESGQADCPNHTCTSTSGRLKSDINEDIVVIVVVISIVTLMCCCLCFCISLSRAKKPAMTALSEDDDRQVDVASQSTVLQVFAIGENHDGITRWHRVERLGSAPACNCPQISTITSPPYTGRGSRAARGPTQPSPRAHARDPLDSSRVVLGDTTDAPPPYASSVFGLAPPPTRSSVHQSVCHHTYKERHLPPSYNDVVDYSYI